MKTDNLNTTIDALTHDLPRTQKFVPPYVHAFLWFACTLIYGALMIHKIGLRPDLPEKWESLFFTSELIAAICMYISGGLAATWLCRPDSHGQTWIARVPLFFAAALCAITTTQAIQQGLHFPLPHLDHCFTDGLLLSAIPAAALMFITARGHTTRPRMMAGMVMTSVIALSYIGLRFTCMMDTVGHSFLYHILPATVFGMAIGLLARRIFRW